MAITTEPAAPTTETPPTPETPAEPPAPAKDGWQLNSPLVLTMVLLLVVLAQAPIRTALSAP